MKLWTALLCAFYLTLDCHSAVSSSKGTTGTWNKPTDSVSIFGCPVLWSKLVEELINKGDFTYGKVMSPIAIEFSMVAYYLAFIPESRSDFFLGSLFCDRVHNSGKSYLEHVQRMEYLYRQLAIEVQEHSTMILDIFSKRKLELGSREEASLKKLLVSRTSQQDSLPDYIKTNFPGCESFDTILYSTLSFTKLWKYKFEKVPGVQFFNKKYSGDFITNTGEYYYENNEDGKYELLAIPTQGGDSQISLYIFLPHIGSNLHSMTWTLAANEYNWLSNRNLVLTQVKVTIPIHITENSTWNFNSILQWVTDNNRTAYNLEEIQKTEILQFQTFKIGDSGVTSDPAGQVTSTWTEEDESSSKNKKKGVSRFMNDAVRQNFMRAFTAKINFFVSRPFMYALVHRKHRIILMQGYVTNIGSFLAEMGGASAIRQRLDP